MAFLLDSTISSKPDCPSQSVITMLGLTVNIVKLLSSPNLSRRQWALAQLPFTARRPISLQEFDDNGVGCELKGLYEGILEPERAVRWEAINAIIWAGCLSLDAIQNGLLGEGAKNGLGRESSRGIMVSLSATLGTETDRESSYRNTADSASQSLLLYSNVSAHYCGFVPRATFGTLMIRLNSLTRSSLKSRTTLPSKLISSTSADYCHCKILSPCPSPFRITMTHRRKTWTSSTIRYHGSAPSLCLYWTPARLPRPHTALMSRTPVSEKLSLGSQVSVSKKCSTYVSVQKSEPPLPRLAST